MAMRFPEDANASLAILRRGGGLSGGRQVFKVNGELVRGVTQIDVVDGQIVIHMPLAAVRLEAMDMSLGDFVAHRNTTATATQ